MRFLLREAVPISISSADSMRIGVGIFQDYYQTHDLKSYSPSSVAWIASLELFMMYLVVGYPFRQKEMGEFMVCDLPQI